MATVLNPPESVPKKPVLLQLEPIAESLFTPLKELVLELAATYPQTETKPIIETEQVHSSITNIFNNSSLQHEEAKLYQKIILEVVVLRVYSSLLEELHHEQSETSESRISLITFILLDISIYTTAVAQISDIDLPFIFIHKLMLKNTKHFILHRLAKVLFSLDSKVRRTFLQTQCGVKTASQRPGTEIIDIYNSLASIFSAESEDNVRFLGQLRLFVAEFFNFDENLLNNPRNVTNKHYGLEQKLYNSIKRTSDDDDDHYYYSLYLKVRYYLTYPENLFNDRWLSREQYLVIEDFVNLVMQEDKRLRKQSLERPERPERPEQPASDLSSQLQFNLLQEIAAEKLFSSSYTMTFDLFTSLLQSAPFRQSVMLQIYMMACQVMGHFDHTVESPLVSIRSELRVTKDFWLKMKKVIQQHYKSTDSQFFYLINAISQDSNVFWHNWKKTNFKISAEMLQLEPERLEKTKQTLAKNAKLRNKHLPLYGTNEISRIWKLETGLARWKNSDKKQQRDDKFELLKEEIASLKNTLSFIQEDPEMYTETEINGLKKKLEVLTFKALRLYRENGHWLAFDKTNYELGLAGLLDAELVTEFERKRAEKRAERELQDARELEDEEGDVEMGEVKGEVKAEVKAESESKVVEEELDY